MIAIWLFDLLQYDISSIVRPTVLKLIPILSLAAFSSIPNFGG